MSTGLNEKLRVVIGKSRLPNRHIGVFVENQLAHQTSSPQAVVRLPLAEQQITIVDSATTDGLKAENGVAFQISREGTTWTVDGGRIGRKLGHSGNKVGGRNVSFDVVG